MSVDISKLPPEEIEQLRASLAKLEPKRRRPRKMDTIKYLSEEQVDGFFGVIKDARDIAMFRMIYHRGLRASEVSRIQFSDWNQARDRIRFSRLKGSNGGEYHLTSREVRALRAWLKVRGNDPGPLFLSRNRLGISRRRVHFLMERYGQLAGLPPDLCHPHSLKHSCATHLLNRGESIEDVQDHLGHVSIASTLVYAKFSPKRRAIKDQRLRDW